MLVITNSTRMVHSYILNNNSGGIGGVIRNSNGDWVVVGYWKNTYALNHIHMELIALQQGLQLAAELHHWPLEVETDSTEVIQLLEQHHPIYQSLINSCRCLLKRLGNLLVRHSFRQANTIAHLLAKEGPKQAVRNQLSVMVSPPTSVMSAQARAFVMV